MTAVHDPLCVDMNQRNEWRYPVACACDLITRARADEREKARQRFAHLLATTPMTITITPPIESLADAFRTALDTISAGGES